MPVPPAVPRADDAALLTSLADPATSHDSGEYAVLDGSRLAYLVTGGRADLFAVRRRIGSEPHSRERGHCHFLATFRPGTVVPSSTVLGAWQLVLAPLAGAAIRPLSAARLRGLGYGGVAEPVDEADSLVPAPRALPVLAAALARGIDAALLALADALRAGCPPSRAAPIGPGLVVSLDAGASVTGDGMVGWLRVAGGHARRNGEHAAVFGGAEPALLAGRDWLVVDGPAIVESMGTADLLAAGHLPAALDHHTVLTLRSIEARIGAVGGAGGVPVWPPGRVADPDLNDCC
jgi:hypothetical protein